MPSPFLSSAVPPGRLSRAIIAVAGAAWLGGCINQPIAETGPSPSDPAVRVPALSYQPVTSGVRSFRPVEPKGWEELNRNVTPKEP